MDSKRNHQEMFYKSAPKKIKLDAYKKQVKPNEGLEQDMETNAKNNASDMIESDSGLSVTKSGECSMGDDQTEAGVCVININANVVNEGVFEVSPDGNGQSRSGDETQMMYDAANEASIQQTDENLHTAQIGELNDETECDCKICCLNFHVILLRLLLETHSFDKMFAQCLQISPDQSLISEECKKHFKNSDGHGITIRCGKKIWWNVARTLWKRVSNPPWLPPY
ncbi:hypothetical protein T4B_4220 [Trichinella pseudospiralis]|uniref:Uncharacterized protein n=1 Tax=Trichinella pseudospiralis TaxID=6337 RepID=A0A0V1DY82_TRIPS|nr:hypothetical protein T4A_6875 [Trichinella pseudospiralis]KRZ22104.1 hypothetical protein T4B_4220 [Trichinella pseudospiralis]KRZ34860.1 hypothetical protein T4C_5701 [Trichinella pseudospiralis]